MVLGALVKLEIIRVDRLNQLLPGRAEKTAETSPLLDKEPFLVLNLNAPEIIAALESRLEPDKKTARLQSIMSMLKSMVYIPTQVRLNMTGVALIQLFWL